MENRLDIAGMLFKEMRQFIGMNNVTQVPLGDVFPFDAIAQAINDNNVGFAALFKGSNNIGTDKPGTTSDDKHCILLTGPPCPDGPRRLITFVDTL